MHCCLYDVRTACCSFCCARAAYALILKRSDYVSYSSRFIFRHRMPPASFWYYTYSGKKVLKVTQQPRQQCAWCLRWTTDRCDMRTYCYLLLAACENRPVAIVRNTIWMISTHTAVGVVLLILSELRQRLAGTKPRACKYMQHVDAA